MDLALALTGLLMGLAGAPHCTAMCGPACAAVLGGAGRSAHVNAGVQALPVNGSAVWLFHGMRVAGYAAAGALVAAGVGVMAWAGQAAPLFRPVWTLLHVAALALGLWLLITARQPGWMTRIGRARPASGATTTGPAGATVHPVRWVSRSRDLQAGAAGGLWVAWPCGLLQSALVVAGLANTPVAGAVVMFAFATSSALGLHLAPALWSWWSARGSRRPHAVRWEQLVVRLTGALLALGSLWALGQDVWGRVWAYCFG
jgi:sulfite exporter TauE/SafE